MAEYTDYIRFLIVLDNFFSRHFLPFRVLSRTHVFVGLSRLNLLFAVKILLIFVLLSGKTRA